MSVFDGFFRMDFVLALSTIIDRWDFDDGFSEWEEFWEANRIEDVAKSNEKIKELIDLFRRITGIKPGAFVIGGERY